MMKFNKANIPNYLSLFRIFLVPIYILFFFGKGIFSDDNFNLIFSGLIFILAGVTDFLDGVLARKNNWISDLGKLLDPLADKLMELSVTVCLAIRFKGPFILLSLIIIIKEAVMIFGAYLILSKVKICVSSSWYGKLATTVWYVLICLLTFFPIMREKIWICNLLCYALIAFMIMSFIMYMRNYKIQIKDTKDVIKENRNKDAEKKGSFKEAKDFILKK